MSAPARCHLQQVHAALMHIESMDYLVAKSQLHLIADKGVDLRLCLDNSFAPDSGNLQLLAQGLYISIQSSILVLKLAACTQMLGL